MTIRHAKLAGHGHDKLETIRRYLPSNYSADSDGGSIWIHGADVAGWTLDGYVLPRLASGLYFAHEYFPEDGGEDRSEAALRARAQMLIPDSIEGTDLITVEVGGQPEDLILTRENAAYLHWKLALILDLPCEDEALQSITDRRGI